ncbi:hypothetical protein B296_00026797, partial [Ensete ventricosum]
ATDRDRESSVESPGSPFSSPSSSFSLGWYHLKSVADGQNRLLLLDSNWRQLKSTITGRFRVVTGWKQPQSAVSSGSGQFAYQSTGGQTGTYRPFGIADLA